MAAAKHSKNVLKNVKSYTTALNVLFTEDFHQKRDSGWEMVICRAGQEMDFPFCKTFGDFKI